jgi:succinate-semialdehyde dehydrogenase / glutarate-semialdehyde dehydrogenase
VSLERMYVADEVYERFLAKLLKRVEAMKLSASLDFTGDMGSLISQSQLDTVTAHVDDARAKGARVMAGGRARPDVGPLFYEPTVLEGVDPSMRCFADETFGPVVSLYRFSDEAEALARANEGCYGLNGSIYTRSGRRGRALAAQLTCGTVNVNEPFGASFASIDSPMGGMRDSGLGRRQGAEGVHRYTESQTVATQRVLPIAPAMGMGDKTFARVLTGALRALKKSGRA